RFRRSSRRRRVRPLEKRATTAGDDEGCSGGEVQCSTLHRRTGCRVLPLLKVVRFRPQDKLIIIWVRIFGPLGDRRCRFALDTAASTTLVVPGILDALG